MLEFSKGHTEVLYSQTLFLSNSDYQVHLLCDQRNKARVESFDTIDSFYYLDPEHTRHDRFKQIKTYLSENKIEQLVVNTAAWSAIRYLPFMLWDVEIIGIVHSLDKLRSSFYQRLLSLKIKKYFVLSEYLLKETSDIKNISFSSFYPMFFPMSFSKSLREKGDEFWICIPGQVEYKRRDYDALVNSIDTTLDHRIKFILLGRHDHQAGDGTRLMYSLKKRGLEKYFIFFDDFIEDAEFHAWLKGSDLLMPLPHENGRYFQNAISGTFNLSYASKKPQLMPNGFRSIDEFSSSMLFYQADGLVGLLNSYIEGNSEILAKTKILEDDERLTQEYQTKRYLDLIERTEK